MKLTRTESFVRDFRGLPADLQVRVDKALRCLATNQRHPSLRVKKMEPKEIGIFEARVSQGYRMTFTARSLRGSQVGNDVFTAQFQGKF